MRTVFNFLTLIILLSVVPLDLLSENEKDKDELAKYRHRYFNVDQGVTYSRVSDQNMSKIHYSGFGLEINFRRFVETHNFISELGYLNSSFNYMTPAHNSTEVLQPRFGFSYSHLRKTDYSEQLNLLFGGEAVVFADFRIIPVLSNSFLYADFISALRPKAMIKSSFNLFREWNYSFSGAFSLLGYGLRIPEYGPVFKLSDDGGMEQQAIETIFLSLANYRHIATELALHESFGDDNNPNKYKISYMWDFYVLENSFSRKTYNAMHRLAFTFYLKTN